MGEMDGEESGVEAQGVEAQYAFRSWLTAAAQAAGRVKNRADWPALAEFVAVDEPARLREALPRLSGQARTKTQAQLDGLTTQTRSWRTSSNPGSVLSNWGRRGLPTRPNPHVLGALRSVVPALVRTPPHDVGTWTDFRILVEELGRRGQQEAAKAGAQAGAREQARAGKGRTETLKGLLTVPPGPARDLDLTSLWLGSWAFNGALPPYLPRTPDQALSQAIADRRPFTVVVGPPKSGKTRSLAQLLTTTIPDAPVWWVNCAPGVLTKIADILERETRGNGGNLGSLDTDALVIVLDDIHRCGTQPQDGLTDTVLARLTRHAHVIATLHDHQLTTWRQAGLDHTIPGADLEKLSGLGVTKGLLERIEANRIDYPPVLDADEYPGMIDILATSTKTKREPDGAPLIPSGAERWAEYLAAVDQLIAKAHNGLAAGGYRHAIVNAAIAAAVLYPAGATPDELNQLTRWEYDTIAPTRLWNPAQYETALEWATDPIGGGGSPHAIIQTTPARDGYQLMDRLQAPLTNNWTTTSLLTHIDDLPDAALFYAGAWEYTRGATDLARTWWEKAADHEHADALFNLGVLAYEAGDLDQARTWLLKAADHEHAVALFNLGVLAEKAGDLDQARTWYLKAADHEHAGAMFNLGVLAEEAGDPEQARTWWERAADHDDAVALFNLGVLAEKAGDLDQARTWWERAADHDYAAAMNNLGVLAEEAGDLDQARTWWERAADHDYADAMYNLGILTKRAGDPDQARTWWEKAADHDDADAMNNLGVLAEKAGDPEQARTWYLKAADHDDAGAMFNLGVLAERAGDLDQARTWYLKADDHDDADAMYNLGSLAKNAADPEQARTWYLKAADHDDADAMYDLGVLALDTGDLKQARTWWLKAADHGISEAIARLRELDGEDGRDDPGDGER